jgi:hypothetical protein
LPCQRPVSGTRPGSFKADGQTIFFKIDYYDKDLKYHSPDPADPTVTERVITITAPTSRPAATPPVSSACLAISCCCLPDRIGNNRLDTMTNLLVNPWIGLLFLVPGMNETLRINGTARITDDMRLLAPSASSQLCWPKSTECRVEGLDRAALGTPSKLISANDCLGANLSQGQR